jgi:hypothetical protein
VVLAGSLPDGAALAQDGPQRCGELPPAVAEKRRAILAAADSDPEDLAALTDPQEFTSNYGGEEMLAYWQWLAEEVDIREIAKSLLAHISTGRKPGTISAGLSSSLRMATGSLSWQEIDGRSPQRPRRSTFL